MGFWLILIVCISCFVLLFIVKHLFGSNGLITLGIGGIVGSNVYHIIDYPITDGNFIFGIDSVIYTLFLSCVILLVLENQTKIAYLLMYSGIGAVLFNAVLQFCASWGSTGIESGVIYGLLSNFLSAFATFVAVFLILKLPQKLQQKNWNKYLIFILCVLLASLINSLIYYGGLAVFEGGFDASFGWTLLSSYIGKILSIAVAVVLWLISNSIYKKKSLNKEKKQEENSIEKTKTEKESK